MASAMTTASIVLIGLALLSCVHAEEEEEQDKILKKIEKAKIFLLETPDTINELLAQVATSIHLGLLVIFIFFKLFEPILLRRKRDISSWNSGEEDNHGNMDTLRRLLNSVNYVEATFAFADIKGTTCKKQKICELQKVASESRLLGDLVKYVRTSIRSLDAYKDALEAGETFKNCHRLFKCPMNQ